MFLKSVFCGARKMMVLISLCILVHDPISYFSMVICLSIKGVWMWQGSKQFIIRKLMKDNKCLKNELWTNYKDKLTKNASSHKQLLSKEDGTW
jgi:hypothetical protein